MFEASPINRCPILILGIGNILLRDEGIGPHVIDKLKGIKLPDYVELLDGGTGGADLTRALCGIGPAAGMTKLFLTGIVVLVIVWIESETLMSEEEERNQQRKY